VTLRRADGVRLGVASSGAGEPTVGRVGQTNGDTVHFDIIDKDGNMISATPSGGWLQSSPVIPELGFPLGTRGQMFWLEEGLPGSLAPASVRAARSQPTLAHRDGKPYMVWGSPGGDQQDQWITQHFLRHVHCDMNCRRRSMRRPGTASTSPHPSGRAPHARACSCWKAVSRRIPSPS
jgi:gamma-glutamyltranspeptidase/glutathione hydrolase